MSKRIIFLALSIIITCASCVVGIGRARKSIDVQVAFGKPNVVHVLIAGSGPAGLSAAIYAARFGWYVVVIRGPQPGGLLTKTSEVENWPGIKSILGMNLISEMENHARSLGVQFVQDTIETVDFSGWPLTVTTQNGVTLNALSVIIATGSSPLMLGVPGESKYWGFGETSCAKCDAPFYKGEDVVVIGGGDSAVEEAIQLAPYAKRITILVRKDRMRASQIMQDRLSQYPSISALYNHEVTEILGDGNQVTGVTVFNNKTRQTSTMNVAGVFLAIGHKPNTGAFASAVKLDANGCIKMVEGRSQKTSVPGVFAAGDIEDSVYRQAVVAAGSGVKAAIDADAFLVGAGITLQVKNQLKSHLYLGEILEHSVYRVTSIKEFDELVGSGKLVVADFYTDDCPQCKELEPIFGSVSKECGSQATFVKVNAQDLLDLSDRLHIYNVPCVMIFNKGQLVARYARVGGKDELKDAVERCLK